MTGRIIGMGGYVPENIVTNTDLETLVDTDNEWIIQRTGIKERRISTGENTTEIAIKAAKKAIESAGIAPQEVDLIVVATVSPDSYTPSTACLVQSAIGADNAMAFDIAAACSGFVYGLNIVNQFIKSNAIKTALVIGAEVLSKVLDWSDRNTCVLFGDGAGAAVVRAEEEGIINIYSKSAGDEQGVLVIPAADEVINPFHDNEGDKERHLLTMDGQEVFKFAITAMKKSILEVLKDSGYTLDDVKYVIPHQANRRIIASVAKKLKTDMSKFYVNLDRFGNTSGASIPLALNEMANENLLQKGDKIILVGFGGGLTWGATLMTW